MFESIFVIIKKKKLKQIQINKGLSVYCVHCGHGGHYDHLFEWFKSNEDCASACGCRCCDYL